MKLDILFADDTSACWPLGGAATMRARCWCWECEWVSVPGC